MEEEPTNCGVLFYSKFSASASPLKMRFLLAQEAYIDGYKNSNTWSAFEGGRKSDETPRDCAIREYFEESLGVVLSPPELKSKLGNVPDIILKVVREDSTLEFIRCLYLVEIDYDYTLPSKFDRKRKEILDAISDIQKYDALAQKSLDMNLPVVGHPNSGIVFLDIFHVHLNSESLCVHCNGIKNGEATNSIVCISANETIALFFKEYKLMVSLWTKIKMVASVHKNIFVPLKHHNILRSYSCPECFLEKKNLAWVSTDTLVKNLRPRKKNKINLRYNFAVMISHIIDKLVEKL